MNGSRRSGKGKAMENPDTWGPAEKIVQATYDAWVENLHKPADEKRYGMSLAGQVVLALREAKLLKEIQE
jgi:hypothetical protein